MIGAIGAGVQLALGKSRYHLSPIVASARSANEKHYHMRQLVGGQTHTVATSRWEPAAEQGRQQQHIQENTGNQWAFSLVVCSHSFGRYKPCLNGLQLLQTASDGRRSFLKAKTTPRTWGSQLGLPPPPPKKRKRASEMQTQEKIWATMV